MWVKYSLFSLNRQIEICEKLLNETDRIIDVAVLGQFKAGKSSFFCLAVISAMITYHLLISIALALAGKL